MPIKAKTLEAWVLEAAAMDWQKQLCELESQAEVFLQQRCPLSKARLSAMSAPILGGSL